jgi:hypothetical protein
MWWTVLAPAARAHVKLDVAAEKVSTGFDDVASR